MHNIPYKTVENILLDNCLEVKNHHLICQLRGVPFVEIEYKQAQKPESVEILDITSHVVSYDTRDVAQLKDMAKVILELAIAAKHVDYQAALQVVNKIIERLPGDKRRYIVHLDGNDFGQHPNDMTLLEEYLDRHTPVRIFILMACCIHNLLDKASE